MRPRTLLCGAAVAAAALLLAGCVAKRLSSAGAEVRTVSQPPGRCQRLGEVSGRSGGWVSGDVTSPRDLELGARNDLRNAAARLGADTVQILRREGTSGQTFSGHAAPNVVVYRGVAWRCGR